MKNILVAVLMLLMAGCASVAKIESGDRVIGERMSVKLDGAWNQVNAPGLGPAEIWTMEGLPVDQLRFYVGLKDGQAIHPERDSKKKTFNFRSSMQADEIASLFEGMLTQDGSTYRLAKIEPAAFGGGKGFRFEYALTRKVDNVQLSGMGYGAVHNGELFAILYMAPRLAFFERHSGKVEQIARSSLFKD
jgi:hypothetical protein